MNNKEVKSSYSFRPKVQEAPEILEFLSKQTNFQDAIRFLIEKEIAENGIRDLALYIPQVRSIRELKEITKPTHEISLDDDTSDIKNNTIAIENNSSEELKKPENNITQDKKDTIVSSDIISCYE